MLRGKFIIDTKNKEIIPNSSSSPISIYSRSIHILFDQNLMDLMLKCFFNLNLNFFKLERERERSREVELNKKSLPKILLIMFNGSLSQSSKTGIILEIIFLLF